MTYQPMNDDEIEAWTRKQRRNAALRVLGVGLFVLVPSLVWLIGYLNWESTAMITRTKVVGGVASSIGALLVIAGLVLLVRARRPLPDQIPRATARERDR